MSFIKSEGLLRRARNIILCAASLKEVFMLRLTSKQFSMRISGSTLQQYGMITCGASVLGLVVQLCDTLVQAVRNELDVRKSDRGGHSLRLLHLVAVDDHHLHLCLCLRST